MQIVVEATGEDAEELLRFQSQHPDHVDHAEIVGIEGGESFAFIVEMTEALAPHVVTLLTVLLSRRRRVVVVIEGERSELTPKSIEDIKNQVAKAAKEE